MELQDEFLINPKISIWDLSILAAVHARQGDTDRAVELLRRTAQLDPFGFQTWFEMAGVEVSETEELVQLLADFDAEIRRLREAYGPGGEPDRR